MEHANIDVIQGSLEEGVQTGKIEHKGGSGKRKILAQIMREMMAIDPERALVVAKSWVDDVKHMARRTEETDHKTLEEYLPYRSMDVGYSLWHGLVTYGCAITIPDEELELSKQYLIPALYMASLTNDMFSYEKEKNDKNVQNAVVVLMREHGCSEAEAKERCKKRIRLETAKYVQNMKDVNARTDVSDELKRYIGVIQYTLSGNLAWSTHCPRYHKDSKWSELQYLRAEHGIAKYPATYQLDEAALNRLKAVSDGAAEKKSRIMNRKRKMNGHSVNGTNGVNGHKKQKRQEDAVSALVLEDVVNLALDLHQPDLNDTVVLQPYRYLTSLPSKGFRDQAIEALNQWFQVPNSTTKQIKEIIKMLHSASLMLDDLEDSSPLRRGKPSTHSVYGDAQTINSATYQYTTATSLAAELPNQPTCSRIFNQEVRNLFVGQSYDLYWTHSAVCPSVSEYFKMVDLKTGSLFRLLTRFMVAESPLLNDKNIIGGTGTPDSGSSKSLSGTELDGFSVLLGRFFQIRDDYQNLASADYAKQKGFAEDLDEGKYSFTLIHCVQAAAEDPEDELHLRAFLIKRRAEGKLDYEAKKEVLDLMERTGSLVQTRKVLAELHIELERELYSLEDKFGEENFSMRIMLDMLKV